MFVRFIVVSRSSLFIVAVDGARSSSVVRVDPLWIL